jgi:hypothetical protein
MGNNIFSKFLGEGNESRRTDEVQKKKKKKVKTKEELELEAFLEDVSKRKLILFNCDICRKLIFPDDPRWVCWQCDDRQTSFDMCSICFDKNENSRRKEGEPEHQLPHPHKLRKVEGEQYSLLLFLLLFSPHLQSLLPTLDFFYFFSSSSFSSLLFSFSSSSSLPSHSYCTRSLSGSLAHTLALVPTFSHRVFHLLYSLSVSCREGYTKGWFAGQTLE